jgi:hypothetical protein
VAGAVLQRYCNMRMKHVTLWRPAARPSPMPSHLPHTPNKKLMWAGRCACFMYVPWHQLACTCTVLVVT